MTWLSDPDHLVGALMALGAVVWLIVAVVALVLPDGDTDTYWLDGEPISRAERDHLTGGRR